MNMLPLVPIVKGTEEYAADTQRFQVDRIKSAL